VYEEQSEKDVIVISSIDEHDDFWREIRFVNRFVIQYITINK